MGKGIIIEPKRLYRLLAWGCRYGYTRNNHIMPDGAFSLCKELLPKLLKADKDAAIRTAEQLCDECISDQLASRFYDGDDDDSGNRRKSIEFVQWLLCWIKEQSSIDYKPCNYAFFLENVALDDKPQYIVKELFGFDAASRKWKSSKVLNKSGLLTKKNYFDFIINDVCGLEKGDQFAFNRFEIHKKKHGIEFGKPIKFIYRFLLKSPRTFLVEKAKEKPSAE